MADLERVRAIFRAAPFVHQLGIEDAWLGVVAARDATCREMRDDWF